MEPAPPPITIVNPHLPGGGELLAAGPERPPWRPSTTQRHLALTAAVLMTLVAGLSSAIGIRRADAAADRRALAQLQLATDYAEVSAPMPEDAVALTLRNDGPDPVQVLEARLLADGYDGVTLDLPLVPGGLTTVLLTDSVACSPSLVDHPADVLQVRLRTARDQVVTRDVPLSPGAFVSVNRPPRERCGYLPADEAFSTQVVHVRARGRFLVVDLDAYNDSLLELTLLGLKDTPGLHVLGSTELPLRLPPKETAEEEPRGTRLTVHLRVADCPTVVGTFPQGGLVDAPELVRGFVTRGPSVYEVPVALLDPEGDDEDSLALAELLRSLAGLCGHLLPG